MDDEDADLIAAKLASIQEAQEAGIPVLEDIDEALAKSLQEQQDAEAAVSGEIPPPPPAPKPSATKGKKSSSTSAPKPVVPVWKEFVYVEFCFSATEVKEGIMVALDYNNFAEGAPMQRVGDKHYQTIALGCGKTYKYKVRFPLLFIHLFPFIALLSIDFFIFGCDRNPTNSSILSA